MMNRKFDLDLVMALTNIHHVQADTIVLQLALPTSLCTKIWFLAQAIIIKIITDISMWAAFIFSSLLLGFDYCVPQ